MYGDFYFNFCNSAHVECQADQVQAVCNYKSNLYTSSSAYGDVSTMFYQPLGYKDGLIVFYNTTSNSCENGREYASTQIEVICGPHKEQPQLLDFTMMNGCDAIIS